MITAVALILLVGIPLIAVVFWAIAANKQMNYDQSSVFLQNRLSKLVPEIIWDGLMPATMRWRTAVTCGMRRRAEAMREHVDELKRRPQEDPEGMVAEQYDGEWREMMFHLRLLDPVLADLLPNWQAIKAWDNVDVYPGSGFR